MLRDFGWCVEEGYTAEEYASAWASDLYNQVFDSSLESFWQSDDIPEGFEEILSVSEEAEEHCLKVAYDAYLEAYKRFQVEPSVDFHDYEVDEAVYEISEAIHVSLAEHLEDLLELEGKVFPQEAS